MKFKAIFIVFNLVIVFSFAFIFFMPLLMLGQEYFPLMLEQNLIPALLFIFTFIIINSYFLSNWKLFNLLEAENWPRLIEFLEEEIFTRNRVRGSYIKMLINAYLLSSAIEKITALEAHIAEKKPLLINRYAIHFGIPYLLKMPAGEAENYFSRLIAAPKVHSRLWVEWNYAFSLMQQHKFKDAREILMAVAERKRDHLLLLLTLYLLDSFSSNDAAVAATVSTGCEYLKKRYTQKNFQKKLERSHNNIEVLLLSRIFNDALGWLFRPEPEIDLESTSPRIIN
ncbi:MAG: hypothetical protein GH155_01885 [Spirochaeta sp.]|nr:hypothetical protein [Spirochaeta sp.]